MTALSRAFILAGFVVVSGASGALADGSNRDVARNQQGYEGASQNAPVLREGRSSATGSAAEHRDGRSWLTDRRSSDDNN